jgi:hypothetical protein
MMMAENTRNDKVQDLMELAMEMSRYVERAIREESPIHEVEREIWQRLLQLGHLALRQFLAGQGTGDLGETWSTPEGRNWKRLKDLHPRVYQSIFGAFTIDRTVYGSREGQKIEAVPLDARLQLPESEFSYVLQDWAQALGVEHAFARTAEVLRMILNWSPPVASLERMNQQMAESVTAFRESRPAPQAKEEGEILVVTADNKGVPMRRKAERLPAGCHRKKGEKANKKQMAAVGCVYTVDSKSRTPEAVVAALFRERPCRKTGEKSEPVARHKRLWSSLSYEWEGKDYDGEENVFAWMAREVSARRKKNQAIVCVMDGQRSLWGVLDAFIPDEKMVEILDLLHVAPRLWEAAHLFHAEGSVEAVKFVRERMLRVLRGEAGYVIGGLRQMGTKRGLKSSKGKKLQAICNYLEKNLPRMRYDEYLTAGYPIASGVIEGACRYVVKDRMERAGMRWTVAGAQAMLDLRTTYVNGQWHDFQAYRIKQERKRLYPYQPWLHQPTGTLGV